MPLFASVCALAALALPALQVASLTPASAAVSGQIQVTSLPGTNSEGLDTQDTIPQMPGWPVTTGRHPNFVPTRGVVFADLDGDGKQEILAPSTQGFLYAWHLDGTAVAGFPVSTIGFPQYPPSVADLDGDGHPEIVQTTRGLTSGGRLYVFDRNGNILPGWPKSLNNNNVEYSAALADLDNDGKLEIIVGERAYPIGRLHVFEMDGTEWGGNWPVTLDHVPAQSAAVADVDGDGNKEVFYASYNSMYLIKRDGTMMPGWPKQIPNANFSYQCAALADVDHDGKLEIAVGAHQTAAGCYVFRYDGTIMPGWPQYTQTWTYGAPTVTDLENDGNLEILDGQAGYVTGPSNAFWVWNSTGQVRAGFPYVVDHGGGSEGPFTVADVDGDGVQEVFADHNEMVSNQGYLFGMSASGQDLPGFPLRTNGFTYMNGATIGDVDGDGHDELGVIAYNDTTVTIYLYTLPWLYKTSGLEWPTYHARNVHDGLFAPLHQITPDAYHISRGFLVGGDLSSVQHVDGNYLTVKKGITAFVSDYPVTVEFDGTSPTQNPSSLRMDATFHVSTASLGYVLDLFDFAAGSWDVVDSQTGIGPLADTTVTVTGSNVSRYVQPVTGKVRARIRVKNPGIAVSSTFNVLVDAIDWRIAS